MSFKDEEWPLHPKIYEINTWSWLQALSESSDREINLLDIPEGIVDLDLSQFDAVWLMGVWERSPQGREIALNHPDLQEEYHNALTDFKPEDVVGSPYAVHYYHVDYHLGGNDGLDLFREQLAEQDIRLILDYVPNHTAVDHLWTLEKSNIFIEGTEENIKNQLYDYFYAGEQIIAHGKDPYFFPWTDTAQINAFSQDAREKTIKALLSIAEQCDGVRCDMAMLVTNEVFKKTWGEKAGPVPETEFWEVVIPAIKEKYPYFKFFAEVYWDLEYKLMKQGFDFCYDKKLYDRLKNETAKTVKSHLQADWDYQRKLLRFIENHDEQRAMSAFGRERGKAAAILTFTLPGARLIYEGQMNGYKIKLPVQLGRRQAEEDDLEIMEFYLRLINSGPGRKMTSGTWSLSRVESVGDFSNTNLIAHLWKKGEDLLLTVVNFSPYIAKGHIKMENINFGQADWSFTDLLAQDVFVYQGENLETHGLYVDLPAWNGHIFEIKKAD